MNRNTLFFLSSISKKVKMGMANINFYPLKARLAKEIQQCIASGKADTLLSFCNSCIFNTSPMKGEPECRTCYINQAIGKSMREQKLQDEIEIYLSVAG